MPIMSAPFNKALHDAVLLLHDLPRERSAVRSAHVRFEQFQNSHAGVRCNLLVDQPPASDAADYDILLGSPDGGTVALSWSADHGLPWTVQHSDHWAANYVLTVNDRHLTIQSALIYLSTILNQTPGLMGDLVNKMLTQEAIYESPVAVSNSETEKEVDRFRTSHRLFSAASMREWLREMGLDMAAVRELAAGNVSARKLKKRLTASRVRPYFEGHRNGFEVVTILRLQVPSRSIAVAVSKVAGKAGLLKALNDKGSKLTGLNGQLASLFARDLPQPFAEASPGSIIGPERCTGGYWIGQLLERKTARLDARTRNRIGDLLFAEWLAERTQQAQIRWHWV